MHSNWKSWLAIAATACVASTAQAGLVNSAAGVGPGFTIGFDSNTGVGLAAPWEVGGGTGYSVTFTPANGVGSVGGPPSVASPVWSFNDPISGQGNGSWSAAKTFAAIDGGVEPQIASMTFTLNGFTAFGIGGFLNFDPTFTFNSGSPLPLYIAALDSSGNVLDSAELPIFTGPDSIDDGRFYGFRFDEATIAAFYIEGPYAAIDDLTIAPIPEPSTYAMLLAGLGLLGFMARRRAGRG